MHDDAWIDGWGIKARQTSTWMQQGWLQVTLIKFIDLDNVALPHST